MFQALKEQGYEVEFTAHADAILTTDFATEVSELESILADFRIHLRELIEGGGGEAPHTIRLRKLLEEKAWLHGTIGIEKKMALGVLRKGKFKLGHDEEWKTKEFQTHDIDHVRRGARGTIALEIEWNNKDPFYDRDLENFKRLHAEGAFSVGVILTRGAALQEAMRELVEEFAQLRQATGFESFDDLNYSPSTKFKQKVNKKVEEGNSFREVWAKEFVSSKFGTATTHFSKLMDRVRRGVGNPCPLLLIGFPPGAVLKDNVGLTVDYDFEADPDEEEDTTGGDGS
jgi:hypothetical protein